MDQRAGVTPHRPGLEVFPGATARSHWTGGVAAGQEEAWTAPVPALGMTCLTTGPEETILPRHHGAPKGPGAQMMRAAAGEEEEEGGEEVEVEAGLTILPATASTNPE